MKRLYIPVLCLLMFHFTALAQTAVKMAAKENVNDVIAKGKTALASDVQLMTIIFVESTAPTLPLAMDLTSGKADDWTYQLYSPSLDSSMSYLVLNYPGLGKLVQAVPGTNKPQLNQVELAEPYLDSPDALQALKNGDAGAFFQTHADASVKSAIAVNGISAGSPYPAGKYWVFYLQSATDSVICYIDGATGASFNCVSATTALEGIPEATGYRLDQNFPNPVSLRSNTGTTIRYAVAERQPVRLAVYDMLGREIAVMQNGFVNTGEYSMTLPASTFTTSGLYFYRLETSHGSTTNRLIVTE